MSASLLPAPLPPVDSASAAVSHHVSARRLALSFALLAGGLGACTDTSPVAPEPLAEVSAQLPLLTMQRGVLSDLIGDARTRVLGDTPADAPVAVAFTVLHRALQHGTRETLAAAVYDAELALQYSQSALLIDEADRGALALHLQVVRQHLSPTDGR